MKISFKFSAAMLFILTILLSGCIFPGEWRGNDGYRGGDRGGDRGGEHGDRGGDRGGEHGDRR
jgi:hypothetical protein